MADLQPDTTPATPAKWLAYLSKLKWILPWLPPLLVATVYAGFIYHFFPSHRHQMNPDGVGYIAVAQKYAAGHFAHAVNAYWSPLYSWLLVPLLWIGREPFGVDALLATKLLAVAIGAATLIALWRLLRHAGVQTDLLALAAVAAIPLIVDAAFMVTTPDLLVACCILFYLAARLNPAPANRWTHGITIGLAGALAYLAKAYALPFVIAHLLLNRLIQIIPRGKIHTRKQRLIDTLIPLATLALIVAAWSAALTHKYGHFTTGSTGAYNLRLDAPHSPGQVMHFAGLLPPPDPDGISAWDDITYHLDRLPPWNPLATEADRDFLRKQISDNFDVLLKAMQPSTSWFYPLLAITFFLPLSRADLRPRRPALILAAAMLLYPCGYLILHVEPRFLIPLVLLLLIAATYAIARASSRGLLNGHLRRILAICLIGWTFTTQPIKHLKQSADSGKDVAQWADQLQGLLPPRATVASDATWHTSLYLACYLDLQYFGEPAPKQKPDSLQADLDRLGVDYFIKWKRSTTWPEKAGWIKLPSPADIPLTIYQRPPTDSAPSTNPG